MADETTKDHKRDRTLRLRTQFDEQLRAARGEVPPDYADERDSEPSYRIAVSEPGRRLSVEGEDATEAAKVFAQLEGLRPSRVREGRDTPAPPSWRQGKPFKLVGAVLALLSAIGAVAQALREAGVFGP
jgi:hypothetical protein